MTDRSIGLAEKRTGLMDVPHDTDSPPTMPAPGIGGHAAAVMPYSAIHIAQLTGGGEAGF